MHSPSVILDHSVALQLASMETGRGEAVILPLPHFSDLIAQAFAEIHGGQVAVPRGALIEEINPSQGFGHLSLRQFGIPYGHVLRAGRGGERRLFALANDEHRFAFAPGIRAVDNPWWHSEPEKIRFVPSEFETNS